MDSKKDFRDVKAVLGGNTPAFAALIDRYKKMVFTIAYRITGNREDAEEVAQDVFLNVYRHLGEFRFKSAFSTWLYKIAYNQSISRIRKKMISTVSLEAENNAALEMYGEEDSEMIEIAEKIPVNILNRALDTLDDNDYTILSLYYHENLPVKEIAKITGLNYSNVKIRLFRGRKKIIEVLSKLLKSETVHFV